MKKIRNLGKRKSKIGNSFSSWAEFYCEKCKNFVERRLDAGIKAISCGCIRKNNKKNYKHGYSYTKLYAVWAGIKKRCNNQNSYNYKYYGGRGITICPEWANDYVVFRDWALSHGYKEGLEIDRRENNGNYEPSNCRWVTRTENQRNKRNTINQKII